MTTTKKQAEVILRKYGSPVKVRPVDALMSLIFESYGNVEWLREKINTLNSMVLRGKQTREELSAWVQLYNDERDRLEKYLLDAGRLGIDQQQMRIYQLQAQAIVAILRRARDEVELTPVQYEKMGKLIASELRAFVQRQRAEQSASVFADKDDDNVVPLQVTA